MAKRELFPKYKPKAKLTDTERFVKMAGGMIIEVGAVKTVINIWVFKGILASANRNPEMPTNLSHAQAADWRAGRELGNSGAIAYSADHPMLDLTRAQWVNRHG